MNGDGNLMQVLEQDIKSAFVIWRIGRIQQVKK